MDVQERTKSGIIAGLELATEDVPFAGTIFALLIEQLWPEGAKEDPWEEIKERVEALIEQKLSDEVGNRVQDSLNGLKKNSREFFRAASHPDSKPEFITDKFNVAKGFFNDEADHFREKSYEVLLLPLFAQMANLHLALLREGCLRSKMWSWSDSDVADVQNDMKTTVKDYTEHVDRWYQSGLQDHSRPVADPGRANEAKWRDWVCGLADFNHKYSFIREMTVAVLDYRTLWPYMDPVKYPTPVKVPLTGELYSDVYGDARPQATRAALDSPSPGDYHRMTRIQVFAGTKIDAVKLWYDGREEQRMPPDSTGGHLWGSGGEFDLSETGRPTAFCVFQADAVWGLGFWFEEGASRLMGFYGHPDDPGDRNRDPISPPDGYDISGITAIGPDLVRAIFFRYRYSNRSPADTSAVISPGTELPKEKRFSSSNGVASLVFQSDGNLVIYDENERARWASGTYDKGAVRCVYEQNGDLCVYDKDGQTLWHSDTRGHPGPPTRLPGSLRVQPDGDVVIYNQAGGAKWSSKTEHAYDTLIRLGTELLDDVPFSSSNTAAILVFQSDGNLVVYDENRHARWASGTIGDRRGHHCVFKEDGDLVVYSQNDDILWNSKTKAQPDAALAVQADGDVVIYDKDRTRLWSTQTAR